MNSIASVRKSELVLRRGVGQSAPLPPANNIRRLKRLVAPLALLVILLLMLRWLERHLIYIPSTRMATTGAELGRPFEDVFLTTQDGVRVNGWFFPAKPEAERPIVFLALHGNAGNISHRLNYYELWLQLGVSVFALDYRGYGRSEGRPDEAGTYLDAQAAYDWLREKGFAATNIVALGESLGGGIAAELAVRETLGGLILQSTFTRLQDLGAELYPWLPVRWICQTQYATRDKLPRLHCPVWILHSRQDTLIPFHHAEQNYAAANEPKRLWEIQGDHNETLVAGPNRYQEGLREFVRYLARQNPR